MVLTQDPCGRLFSLINQKRKRQEILRDHEQDLRRYRNGYDPAKSLGSIGNVAPIGLKQDIEDDQAELERLETRILELTQKILWSPLHLIPASQSHRPFLQHLEIARSKLEELERLRSRFKALNEVKVNLEPERIKSRIDERLGKIKAKFEVLDGVKAVLEDLDEVEIILHDLEEIGSKLEDLERAKNKLVELLLRLGMVSQSDNPFLRRLGGIRTRLVKDLDRIKFELRILEEAKSKIETLEKARSELEALEKIKSKFEVLGGAGPQLEVLEKAKVKARALEAARPGLETIENAKSMIQDLEEIRYILEKLEEIRSILSDLESNKSRIEDLEGFKPIFDDLEIVKSKLEDLEKVKAKLNGYLEEIKPKIEVFNEIMSKLERLERSRDNLNARLSRAQYKLDEQLMRIKPQLGNGIAAEALEECSRARRLLESDREPPSSFDQGLVWLFRAGVSEKMGNYKDAQSFAEKAYRYFPQEGNPHRMVARLIQGHNCFANGTGKAIEGQNAYGDAISLLEELQKVEINWQKVELYRALERSLRQRIEQIQSLDGLFEVPVMPLSQPKGPAIPPSEPPRSQRYQIGRAPTPVEITPPSRHSPIPHLRIPLVDEIAAGQEKPVSDNDILGYIQQRADEMEFEFEGRVLEVKPLKGSRVTFQPEYHYFAARVSGDSMIEAGLAPNDFVILQKTEAVSSGDIVAVVFRDEDDKATLKRIYIEPDRVILRPESLNPLHKPRIVRPQDFAGDSPRVAITGVALAVLKPKPEAVSEIPRKEDEESKSIQDIDRPVSIRFLPNGEASLNFDVEAPVTVDFFCRSVPPILSALDEINRTVCMLAGLEPGKFSPHIRRIAFSSIDISLAGFIPETIKALHAWWKDKTQSDREKELAPFELKLKEIEVKEKEVGLKDKQIDLMKKYFDSIDSIIPPNTPPDQRLALKVQLYSQFQALGEKRVVLLDKDGKVL